MTFPFPAGRALHPLPPVILFSGSIIPPGAGDVNFQAGSVLPGFLLLLNFRESGIHGFQIRLIIPDLPGTVVLCNLHHETAEADGADEKTAPGPPMVMA